MAEAQEVLESSSSQHSEGMSLTSYLFSLMTAYFK